MEFWFWQVAHPRSGSSSISFLVELEFGNAGFLKRGENQSNRRKTSRTKGENHQQTQPTYGVRRQDFNPCDKLVAGEFSTSVPPFLSFSSEQSKPSCKSPLNRGIFVWPWNENEQTNQKQQTNGKRAIWLVYRTDTKARGFGWLSESSGEKTSCPRTF